MEIKIKKIKANKDPRGCLHLTIQYEAKRKDFHLSGFRHYNVWGSSHQDADVELIYEQIVSDVWYAYKEYLKAEEKNNELLKGVPKIKKLKGKKIPESYWLARELKE